MSLIIRQFTRDDVPLMDALLAMFGEALRMPLHVRRKDAGAA